MRKHISRQLQGWKTFVSCTIEILNDLRIILGQIALFAATIVGLWYFVSSAWK